MNLQKNNSVYNNNNNKYILTQFLSIQNYNFSPFSTSESAFCFSIDTLWIRMKKNMIFVVYKLYPFFYEKNFTY